MASIFVSYASKSKAKTRSVVDDLKELGHRVWFDHELSGGQAWWEQILESIRACEVFLFVLDPDSLDSIACTRECEYADALDKRILPVLVSDDVRPSLLPPALSRIHYVDYRKDDRKAAIRLTTAINDLPAAKSLPDRLPKPPTAPVSPMGELSQRIAAKLLSYREQTALLVELKISLNEPKHREDARLLLVKLRTRKDVIAGIANEIDPLLGSLPASTQSTTPSLSTRSGSTRPTYTNDIGMELVWIPGGSFEMGSNDGEENEKPVHTVEITQPFYLGKTVVTQAQWKAVMGSAPWKGEHYVKEGGDYPATCVNWDDAQEFVKALSSRESGKTYRLPTEAEWEYAARGGQGDAYGQDLDKVAWYRTNAWDVKEQYAHRVAQLQPNAWGLCDMLGNVWEWVQDWYGGDYSDVSVSKDPQGAEDGSVRVLRGGSFNDYAHDSRLSHRCGYFPYGRRYYYGFRVLLLPFSEL